MGNWISLILRDFCNNALTSLSNERNKLIFTKGTKSEIAKHLNYNELTSIINNIIYEIFLNGQVKIYFYLKNDILYLSTEKGENSILNKKFKWKLNFLSNHKRRKIIKILKNYDSLYKNQDYNDKNYLRNIEYISEQVNNEIFKLTQGFLYLSINEKKYTTFYYVYCIIRMRKNQLLMVNYVVKLFNDAVKKTLDIKDDDDNIIFNGLSMDKLNELEKKLLLGEDTMKNITDCLFNRYFKEKDAL